MTHSPEPDPAPREDLRVGLIGVNADRGWAREAHVPALRALPGLRLAAVATRRQDSADAAATAFDVPAAYGDPLALIGDPGVDVVSVAAAVPAHRELVLAALAAGKHVLTEWPAGTDTGQVEQMATAAAAADRVAAVGLQARPNPAVVAARRLLADGALGRVVGVHGYSTTAGFGPRVGPGELYLEDPATAMNLRTIQAAHTLDLVTTLCGHPLELVALETVQYPELTVGDPPEKHRRTLPDQVIFAGRLPGGAAFDVMIAGGRPAERTPFRLLIVGTDGDLELIGGAPRGFQSGVLVLRRDGEPVEVDAGELGGLPDPVVNVAAVYAALRDDVRCGVAGGRRSAGLADALALARLLDAAGESNASGATVIPAVRS